MAHTTYTGLVLDGSGRGCEPLRGGREYVTRAAVRRAAQRAGRVLVETRTSGERLPGPNDARGWDQYRLRHGIVAG